MSHLHASSSHPSHHPPTSSVGASSAQGSTVQDSEADPPFKLVAPRYRASSNRQQRDAQQPLITASLTASPLPTAPTTTVSRDIVARRAGQDEQLHTDSQPSKASTASTRAQRTAAERKEGFDLDDRPSSSSASQHMSNHRAHRPLPHCHLLLPPPSHAAASSARRRAVVMCNRQL